MHLLKMCSQLKMTDYVRKCSILRKSQDTFSWGELAPQNVRCQKNNIKQPRDNKIRKHKEEKMKGIGCLVKEMLEHDVSGHMPTKSLSHSEFKQKPNN